MAGGSHTGLMTVGDLAERTGVSRKTIRDLEGRGLIYSTSRGAVFEAAWIAWRGSNAVRRSGTLEER